jgi:hypothetical protein
MYYGFSLTELYRADYKNKVWHFKRPDERDLHAVSEWLAAFVHGSEAWRRRMHKRLLQEFSINAGTSQPMSWMLTASNNRVCFFDIEEGILHEVRIHLTAPPNLLRDNKAALILWRRTVNYLLSLNTWSHLWVELDITRTAEARALEKLGFEKEGDCYSLFAS